MIDIEIGGIYRAVGTDRNARAALVLVTAVDEAIRSLAVTLLSPDVAFGSPADLVLSGAEFGRRYDLLVQSDVFGYLWVDQIDRRIGRVEPQVVQALSELRAGAAQARPAAGPPVVDRSDPRWVFQLQELTRLQALTAACTRALADGDRTDPRPGRSSGETR